MLLTQCVLPHVDQIQHYNHLANESNAQKQRDNKAWVEQYTPDQIRIANLARHRLRTSFAKVKAYPNIPDARQVKRPANIYACFVAERMASGDLKHILIRKGAAKLIADEWRALNDTEKQVSFGGTPSYSFELTRPARNTRKPLTESLRDINVSISRSTVTSPRLPERREPSCSVLL